MERKPVRVVLSGSGTLYPLHAGALLALEDLGYEIKEIVGVSGGAIVGGLYASGINGETLRNILMTLTPSWKLWDFSWLPWKSWGMIRGRKIQRLLRQHVAHHLKDTKIPLHVLTYNIDYQEDPNYPKPTVWSSGTTPDIHTARVIRASMSLPGIFTPVDIHGARHIDGGVAANFPVDFYQDKGDSDIPVIAFRVRGLQNKDAKPKNILQYGDAILNAFMGNTTREQAEDAPNVKVINLVTSQDGMSFDLPAHKISALIDIGRYQATRSLQQALLIPS